MEQLYKIQQTYLIIKQKIRNLMGNYSSSKKMEKQIRLMIQESTKTKRLFPEMNSAGKKPTITSESIFILPQLYKFKSSQQIEKDKPTIQQITHSTSIQSIQNVSVLQKSNWPYSCIGLVICQHHQHNQTFYVYGTGILIHSNIVLINAQNVYCRRMNTQYKNIRFIIGVAGNKCTGIYDVMRVHYPKEYTMEEEYENYNFAVLQLYDDLSNNCGYLGWKTIQKMVEDEKYTGYRYTPCNQEGSFNLRQIKKHGDWECCSGNGVLIQENKNKCYIIGLQQQKKKIFLSQTIRNIVNQWTEMPYITLSFESIDAQGCKYLSQLNWTHFVTINLRSGIGAQGCKYLSLSNWTRLTTIGLSNNKICAQGCKYLSQANWTHLKQINLWQNNIDAQGCKYLSQANWKHLAIINLADNKIGAQGCKYLSQANWKHLGMIYLRSNKIDEQGSKYLSQINSIHLAQLNLCRNNIKDIIYQLLLQQLNPNSKIRI